VAAGYYTLLPGHYALQPGAFKVTVAASNLAPSAVAPNFVMPTGVYYVSPELNCWSVEKHAGHLASCNSLTD
jgi:hypothetical protein